MSLAEQARLVVLESQFADLEERQNAMSEEYRIVERDRDDLYATFESAVGAIQEQSNLRNMLLEQKIDSLEQSSEHAVTQLSEVAGSANLDLHELAQMTEALDDVLVERNKMIRELQYMVTRAAKVSEHFMSFQCLADCSQVNRDMRKEGVVMPPMQCRTKPPP